MHVTLLESLDDLRAAAEALARIWGRSLADPPVSRDMLRALTHSGNYVAGAFLGDELTGVSVGVLGLSGNTLHLHSVVTGVLPGYRGRHVGFALKQHQRAWAMERGIAVIGWTFDPSSVPTPSSTSPSWAPRWSATARTQDVTPPFILEAGHLRVPAGPGLGVAPIAEVLEGVTPAIERVTSRD